MSLPFFRSLTEGLSSTASLKETIFFYALWVGLFLATVHLLTMLLTRWGDRSPSLKSFTFSLLVHLSLLSGWTAVRQSRAEQEASIPTKQPYEEPDSELVRHIYVQGKEERKLDEQGNVPVWEKLPESIQKPLSRLDYSPAIEPVTVPERRSEIAEVAEVTPRDLARDTEELTPPVQDVRNPVAGPQVEAAVPIDVQEPTMDLRQAAQVPSTSFTRSALQQSGFGDPTEYDKPRRGTVDRIAEAPELDSLKSLETAQGLEAQLQQKADEDEIRRRAAPVPSTLAVDEPGLATTESGDGANSSSPVPITLPATPRRSLLSQTQGQITERPIDRLPRTPEPVAALDLSVVDGLDTDLPTSTVPTPTVVRPNSTTLRAHSSISIPPTYRLRDLSRRSEVARKFGGTDASERAVEKSLQWLAVHQNVAGYWDADGYSAHCPSGDRCQGNAGLVKIDEDGVDRQNAGIKADAGLTGLSLLCFLGAGYTQEDGQYADVIHRAITWLVQQQRSDGYLGGDATHFARMYCHAMATYALAEAYGMQNDHSSEDLIREPLTRAINYILANQSPKDGGWRYVRGTTSDMSMFGWQLMALKSAEIAGLNVPAASKQRMIDFLRDRSRGPNGGLAAYRLTTEPPTSSMTAEALFAKQMLGIARANPASQEAVSYLLDHLPKRSEKNLYYWYYGTLAMYQYGGDAWDQWNDAFRDILVEDQVQTGHAAGSWNPRPPWGPYGGRIFSTALSTLSLEVYYRLLPLYRMNDTQVAE